MGRKLRTTLPQTKLQLTPNWIYLSKFKKDNAKLKEKQKENFDHRHRVRESSELEDNTEVWVTTDGKRVEGRVVRTAGTPRSYIVEHEC